MTAHKINQTRFYILLLLAVLCIILCAVGARFFAYESLFYILCFAFNSALFGAFLSSLSYSHSNIFYMISGGVCLISVIAAVIASGGNLQAWVLNIAYIPAGWIMFSGIKLNKSRTAILVNIALFLVILYGVLCANYINKTYDSVSIENVYKASDEKITGIINGFESSLADMYKSANQSGENITYKFSDNEKTELIMNLKMVVPCFFVLYAFLCAYLCTFFMRGLFNIFGTSYRKKAIEKKNWRLHVSAISGGVMVFCSIFNVLFYDKYNLLPTVIIINLMYILSPGFCIMGVYFIYDKLYNFYNRERQSKSNFIPVLIMIIGFLMLSFMFSSAVIAIFAIFGVYVAIIGDMKKFYAKVKNYMLGEDNYDDEIDEINENENEENNKKDDDDNDFY